MLWRHLWLFSSRSSCSHQPTGSVTLHFGGWLLTLNFICLIGSLFLQAADGGWKPLQWPQGSSVITSPFCSVLKFDLAPVTSFHTSSPFQSHLLKDANAQPRTRIHKCKHTHTQYRHGLKCTAESSYNLRHFQRMFVLQTINLHKLGCHAWRSRAWCMCYYIKQLWVYFCLLLYDCFCIFLLLKWNTNRVTSDISAASVHDVQEKYMIHCQTLINLARNDKSTNWETHNAL